MKRAASLLLFLISLLAPQPWAQTISSAPVGSVSGTQADDRNAVNLADFITQRLNTYRAVTFAGQVRAAQEYFDAALLSDSQPYFKTKIDNAVKNNLISLFTPDPAFVQIKRYEAVPVKYDVTLVGPLKIIKEGYKPEAVPLQILLRMEKTAASQTNPYGFRIVVYKESLAANPMPTQLAVPAETGQNPSNTAIGPNKQ